MANPLEAYLITQGKIPVDLSASNLTQGYLVAQGKIPVQMEVTLDADSLASVEEINVKLEEGITVSVNNHPDTFAATQSGTWSVNVSNFPLFTGLTNAELRENPVPISLDISSLATASNQTTANNTLSSIDGKLPSNLTVSSTRLLVDGSGVTQPVSGIITANQGGTWNIGAITTLPAVTLASESGYLTYRNTALSNTPVTVKGTAGSVMGWNFLNSNTVPVYVKFYNLVSGSVTVGTSAVALTIMVPPSDGVTPGMFFQEPDLVPIEVFSTAISIVCVIGLADNSTTAPTTPIHVSVRYK